MEIWVPDIKIYLCIAIVFSHLNTYSISFLYNEKILFIFFKQTSYIRNSQQ